MNKVLSGTSMKTTFWDLTKNVPELVSQLWEAAPGLVVVLIVTRLFMAVAPVIILSLGGRIIDSINKAQSDRAMSGGVWWLLSGEIAMVLVTVTLTRAIIHYDLELSNKFSLKMNLKLISHCNALDLETFEDPAFRDRLDRARNQISSQIAFLQNLLQTFQQIVGTVGVFITACFVAPALIVIQFVAVMPTAVVETYFARRRYALNKGRTSVKRLLDYIITLVSDIQAVKEIKMFSLGSYFSSEYEKNATRQYREDLELSRSFIRAAILLNLLGSVAYYVAYILLISDTISGRFTVGRLVFLAGMLQTFRSQWAFLLSNISRGIDQVMYVKDVFEVYDEMPRLSASKVNRAVPRPIKDGIEFRNVSFMYRGTANKALNSVSFHLRKGEIVALVGANGAGKSTITKLISRLYDPTEGEIMLDGTNLCEYSTEELRSSISSVFQDFVKYNCSVTCNIGFGDVESLHDKARVISAAQQSGADSFITKFQRQYDQVLGRLFEDSVDLSGGQWQRLAIARAFVRDAQIVILDEPTSGIDAIGEACLYDSLLHPKTDRITVLISHRLSTARHADRILVFRKGCLYEEGSHSELMERGGEYAQMFRLQANGYVL